MWNKCYLCEVNGYKFDETISLIAGMAQLVEQFIRNE